VLVIGCFLAVAILLGAAALAKLAAPAAGARALRQALPFLGHYGLLARCAGLAELGVAVFAIGWGSRFAATLLTAAYLAFAAVSGRLLAVAAGSDCGCFGAVSSPVRPMHVAGTVVAAALAATGIAWPPGAAAHGLADQPLAGMPLVVGALLVAWLGYLTFTALPDLLTAQAELKESR
jgi:hypothetical protein